MNIDKLRAKYPSAEGFYRMADLYGIATPTGVRWYTLEEGLYTYAAKTPTARGQLQPFEVSC